MNQLRFIEENCACIPVVFRHSFKVINLYVINTDYKQFQEEFVQNYYFEKKIENAFVYRILLVKVTQWKKYCQLWSTSGYLTVFVEPIWGRH